MLCSLFETLFRISSRAWASSVTATTTRSLSRMPHRMRPPSLVRNVTTYYIVFNGVDKLSEWTLVYSHIHQRNSPEDCETV